MPGRYKPYPEYKDSGIEWLGALPKTWSLKKLKFLAQVIPSNVDKKTTEGELPVLLCNYTDVYYNENIVVSLPFMSATATAEQIKKFTLKSNDTIITKDSEDPKDIAIPAFVPEDIPGVICGYHLAIVRPYESIYGAYIKRVFESGYSRATLGVRSNGLTRYGLGLQAIQNIFFPLPDVKEALKIANFLDHETGKIDALIEKQQQLIKLLQEKRQAVISHAVTKGLNPAAPMKDSGVEWLGQIPAHWEVKRVCQLFSESSRRASTDDELQFPIFSVSIHHGISDKELDEEELDRKVTRSEDRSLYKVVRNNDLAYNMMRAWQGGFGATKLSGLVSPAYVVCNPRTPIDSYFFELVLRTPNAVTELKRYSRGITDFRLRLYWDEFKNILVPVPSGGEVEQILSSIQHTNFLYGKLISVANRQIELLQERRTALISAAVTGKIDVRDWRAPAGSTAYSSQKYRNTGCEDEMEIQNNGEEVADD